MSKHFPTCHQLSSEQYEDLIHFIMSNQVPSDSLASDSLSFKNILTGNMRQHSRLQVFQDSNSLSTVQNANPSSVSTYFINEFSCDFTSPTRLQQGSHATREKGSTNNCKTCDSAAENGRIVNFRSALLAPLEIPTKMTSTSCASGEMSLPASTGLAAGPDSYAACLMARRCQTALTSRELAPFPAEPIRSHRKITGPSPPADPAYQSSSKGSAAQETAESNKPNTGPLPAHQHIGPFPSIQEQDAAGTGSWGRARQGHGPAAEAGGRKRPRSPDRSGARSERDGAAADRHCFKARRDGLGAPRPCRPPHRGRDRDLPDSSGPALESALGSESVRCFGWAVAARAAVPQPPPGPADGASASAARISVWNLAG